MGRIRKILSVIGREIKGDPGGGANTTSQHAAPPGLDSLPLAGDSSIDVPIPQFGREVSVGYRDEKNGTDVSPGEAKLYGRDGSGAIVCSVYCKGDGTIVIQADGDVIINGATINSAGNVTTALGVSLDDHTHTQPNDGGGDTEQPTNPPTPGP